VWLEEQLDELERLVAENDVYSVTPKLRSMIAEPQLDGSAVLEDTLH
jgi:hypothetical protein